MKWYYDLGQQTSVCGYHKVQRFEVRNINLIFPKFPRGYEPHRTVVDWFEKNGIEYDSWGTKFSMNIDIYDPNHAVWFRMMW